MEALGRPLLFTSLFLGEHEVLVACGHITPTFEADAASSVLLLLHAVSSSVCVCSLSHLVIALRAPLANPGPSLLKTLNLITPEKTLFPNKVTFAGSRDGELVSLEVSLFLVMGSFRSTAQGRGRGALSLLLDSFAIYFLLDLSGP